LHELAGGVGEDTWAGLREGLKNRDGLLGALWPTRALGAVGMIGASGTIAGREVPGAKGRWPADHWEDG